MNDVILGSVVGAFVCENNEVIGKSLHDWLKVRSLFTYSPLMSAGLGDNQIRRLPLSISPMMLCCGWTIGLRDLS
jgi:hypothetical protein